MEKFKDTSFGGERPLFASRGLQLDNVTFLAGESALKRCSDIIARNCRFEGKYPFGMSTVSASTTACSPPGARAALWYSDNCEMTDTVVDAPKMFREMHGIKLRRVNFSDAQETLRHCSGIDIEDVTVDKADYIFMHCSDIRIANYRQQGNYSFQYARNVEISNAVIHSKDAFGRPRV